MDFIDRVLKCSDCSNDFIFTAGEQLFFFDRQFKNDPKRCKLCKAKRAGLARSGEDPIVTSSALPLSRTETRTQCSACGVDTTVPFRPTQGRPVFCRSCFQMKRVPAASSGLDPAAFTPDGSSPELSMVRSTTDLIADMPAAALGVDTPSRGMDTTVREAIER